VDILIKSLITRESSLWLSSLFLHPNEEAGEFLLELREFPIRGLIILLDEPDGGAGMKEKQQREKQVQDMPVPEVGFGVVHR
jgi:hypothetical protein